MSENEPVHFRGLPNRTKIGVICAALMLGALSLGFALKNASDTNRNLTLAEKDINIITSIVKLGHTEISNDQTLVAHALNVTAHLKGITNGQSLAILAITGGSTLLAIGFSLFLLGADGAFRLQLVNDLKCEQILTRR